MNNLLNVTSAPHVREKVDTQRIMLYVIIALLPTTVFGIFNFGPRALALILITIATCVASEWIYEKLLKKKVTIKDLSAVVTGLLYKHPEGSPLRCLLRGWAWSSLAQSQDQGCTWLLAGREHAGLREAQA